MSQNPNAKQKALVKTRKASRIIAWLLIFGGGSILSVGIGTQALTSFVYGILIMILSLPMFILSSYANKKLNEVGR